MGEVKIGVCVLIGLLLIMPIILAVDTEVKIKTMPFREVQVVASKANSVSFNLIQRFIAKADEYGDASFVFNFTSTNYDLSVFIKEEGETIVKDKQLGLITGDSQYFEVATSDFVFIETPEGLETNEIKDINETIINDSEIKDVEINDTKEVELNGNETEIKKSWFKKLTGKIVSLFTGNAVEGEENVEEPSEEVGIDLTEKGSNKFYYIIGVIVVAIGGILFVLKRRGFPQKEIKVTKLSDKIGGDAQRQSILDVESKLKDIQDELEDMK